MSTPTFTRRVYGLVEAGKYAAFEASLIAALGSGYKNTFSGTSKTHEEFSTQVTEAEYAKIMALANAAGGVHLYRECALGVDDPNADTVVKDPNALPAKQASELRWTPETVKAKLGVDLSPTQEDLEPAKAEEKALEK